MGLEGQSLIPAQEIEPGHIKPDSWAKSRSALRAGCSRLEFQSDSVSEGVALRLLHLNQDIFLRVGAVGILHRGIHLAENAQIVEPGLSVEHPLLAEWLPFMH